MATQPTSSNAGKTYYRYSWAVLLAIAFAYLLDVFMRFNIPTVIPNLMKEYSWDPVTVGWVDSAYLWTYALSQVPWSIISEKWLGARATVTTGTVIITIAAIIFAFNVSNLPLAIISRGLIGIGSAAVWVPAYPALSRWFLPEKRGIMTGIFGSAASLGSLLGSALMPILLISSPIIFGLTQIGSGFLWSAIPGIIAIVLVIAFAKNKPEDVGLPPLILDASEESDKSAAMSQISDEPTLGWAVTHSVYPWVMCVVYASMLWAFYVLLTWFPTYMKQVYGVNPKSLGIIFGLAVAVPGILGVLISGYLSDTVLSKKTTLILAQIGLLLSALGIAYLTTQGPHVVSFITLMVVFSIFAFFAAMWTLVWPFTTIMFPVKIGGSVGGMMNTTAQLAAAASPVVAGWVISTTGGFFWVFMLSAVGAAIAIILSTTLHTKRVF